MGPKNFVKTTGNRRQGLPAATPQAWGLQLYQKETPAQALSYESRKPPKNTHFHRTPPVAASKQVKKVLSILDKIVYVNTYLNSSFLLILSSVSDW